MSARDGANNFDVLLLFGITKSKLCSKRKDIWASSGRMSGLGMDHDSSPPAILV